jgi:hypothetical protein
VTVKAVCWHVETRERNLVIQSGWPYNHGHRIDDAGEDEPPKEPWQQVPPPDAETELADGLAERDAIQELRNFLRSQSYGRNPCLMTVGYDARSLKHCTMGV